MGYPAPSMFAGHSMLRPYNCKTSLLELDEDDFGVCAEAEGRAPGAGSPGCEHEHFAEAVYSVDVGAVNSARDPGERRKLAAVGVARKLKRDTRGFSNVQSMRGMR